jgi:hypothetical protein
MNELTKIYREEERGIFLSIESIMKEETDLEKAAEIIIEGTYLFHEILKKDSLDKFIDYVLFKTRTGYPHILSMAYPSMRMADRELEGKVIELMNIHLIPDIILRVLKYFARNSYDADSNLQLAYLLNTDDIIRAIYNTFILFKKDILVTDRGRRSVNVKMIQQMPASTDSRNSSPMDAACRFKYVLEFISMKQNVGHLYDKSDLLLSTPVKVESAKPR